MRSRLGAVLEWHGPAARLLRVVLAVARVHPERTSIRIVVGQVVVILGLLRRPLVRGRARVAAAADLSLQLLVLLDLVLGLQGRIHVRLERLLAVAPGLEDLGFVLLCLAASEGIQLAQVLRVAPWRAQNLILVQFLTRLGLEGLLLRGERVLELRTRAVALDLGGSAARRVDDVLY